MRAVHTKARQALTSLDVGSLTSAIIFARAVHTKGETGTDESGCGICNVRDHPCACRAHKDETVTDETGRGSFAQVLRLGITSEKVSRPISTGT